MIRGILLRRARAAATGDGGYALAVVIGIGLVMIIMIAGSLSITTSGVTRADTDQDRIGAEAAAYAGVAEYQSRLSNDSTYQKFGNPVSAFTVATGSRVSLPTGAPSPRQRRSVTRSTTRTTTFPVSSRSAPPEESVT
jgi:hypothetical protein